MKRSQRIFGAVTVIALLLSFSAIFVSSAQNEPVLSFDVALTSPIYSPISSSGPTEADNKAFKELVSSTAFPPFYALIRDLPDITCWMTALKLTPKYDIIVRQGTRRYFELKGVTCGIIPYSSYTDPKGMVEKIREKVDSFVPDGETMYEKLLSIHDYVTSSTTYMSDTEGALFCYSAYGALVDGKAVCEGYAEAFKLLCDRNGIDCVLVRGNAVTSSGEAAHLWNYVRMDDGKWYAVDATWNDAGDLTGRYGYFLIGSTTEVHGETFSKTHLPNYDFSGMTIENFEYPPLSDTAYNKDCEKIDYTYGEGKSYYYDRLNAVQKELYDAMYEYIVSSTPGGEPPATSTPEESTTPEESSGVEDSSPDSTDESGEDTTLPDTTEPDSTESDTSSPEHTEPDTTEPDSTDPDVTLPSDTESNEGSTSPDSTDGSGDESTSPDESSSDDVSSTDTTDTTEPTNTSDTSSTPDSTESTATTDTTSEEESTSPSTTEDQSSSGSESVSSTLPPPETSSDTDVSETDTDSNTTASDTESSESGSADTPFGSTQITTEDEGGGFSIDGGVLYEIVKVTVIVCALICLALILGVIIVKFFKSYDNDDQ